MKYLELKEMHQKRVNEFPLMFAFSNKQFSEGMKKWGLDPEDTDKISSLGGGGFIRKTDIKAFNELMRQNDEELKEQINSSEDFCYDMCAYELGNHEFCITGDVEPTLDSLGTTREEVRKNKNLYEGMKKALKHYKCNIKYHIGEPEE